MSEELQENVVRDEQPAQDVQPSSFNPFSEDSWENEKQQSQPQEQPQVEVEQKQQEEPAKQETPVVDYNQYLKEKFGFDNEEAAINEFNKLKEQKNQDLSFQNEESEKFFKLLKDGKEDEVYNYLAEKKKIETLANSNVDNTDIASDIIKFNLQKKYPDLSQDEIEYKFNKQFAIPEKPEQSLDDTDEDYDRKLAIWEKQKSLAEKELMIEAKLAKPEIDKYRPSLVLPDINRQVQDNSPSKEELAIAENLRNSYLQTLEGDYKNFNGFNVTAKNSEAEFPVSFTPSDDEKVALKNALSNFDQEAYFTSRWIRNDKPDIQQIMKDIYLLENSEKAFQKIANETAAKMQEHLIKSTSNIKIKPETQTTFSPENSKSEMDKMASLFFSS